MGGALTPAFAAAQPLVVGARAAAGGSTRSIVLARVSHRNRKARSTATRRSRQADKWKRVQPGEWLANFAEDKRIEHASELRPESCPALVLNADFSPLSYMPLSLWPWQEVVKAVFLERVTVVATYDVGVRSPSMVFPLPSVVSLKQYQPMGRRSPAFSRFNVFLRDMFSCQYCGRRFATQELTYDHVIPRCKGGKTNWQNVVTACVSCNHRKGRLLLSEMAELRLRTAPRQPTNFELQANAKRFPPRYLHHTWRDYVYWSHGMRIEHDE
ncbi:hypothetical protein BWQ96_02395 [Gracilariopsis chorda]|uniref:HNH nuclease domain-containing protein n=1 Tax=Gracilariopsis chorda TaxID=448386 RepID=A0A2V3J082_9FLOR|nr:hypothetical protein BWQ96_02395 [Gracilariopsis chorda]|eukprot:PXF47713.1 hypothetical protein BWQ96_02395 [Gracilariopsis chorda]